MLIGARSSPSPHVPESVQASELRNAVWSVSFRRRTRRVGFEAVNAHEQSGLAAPFREGKDLG